MRQALHYTSICRWTEGLTVPSSALLKSEPLRWHVSDAACGPQPGRPRPLETCTAVARTRLYYVREILEGAPRTLQGWIPRHTRHRAWFSSRTQQGRTHAGGHGGAARRRQGAGRRRLLSRRRAAGAQGLEQVGQARGQGRRRGRGAGSRPAGLRAGRQGGHGGEGGGWRGAAASAAAAALRGQWAPGRAAACVQGRSASGNRCWYGFGRALHGATSRLTITGIPLGLSSAAAVPVEAWNPLCTQMEGLHRRVHTLSRLTTHPFIYRSARSSCSSKGGAGQ